MPINVKSKVKLTFIQVKKKKRIKTDTLDTLDDSDTKDAAKDFEISINVLNKA